MLYYQSISNQACFVTRTQFIHFTNQLRQQIQLLKNHPTPSLHMPHFPNNQIYPNQQQKQYRALIKSMQMQIQGLRSRVRKLQQLTSNNQRRKAKGMIEQQYEGLILANQKGNEQEALNLSQSYKLMQSSSELQIEQEQDIQATNANLNKCLIETIKTNQGANDEDDDEELIQCVWESSPPLQGNILNNDNHHHNPHKQEFSIARHNNIIDITKLKGQGFLSPSHNFIYKQSVPFGKVSSFRVKRMKVKDTFFIGIGTVYIFGVENAFRHRESIAYSSNGDLWINGDSRKGGKAVKNGEVIQMLVDRVKGEVVWLLDDAQMLRVSIPDNMLKNELYMNIMLFNKDDNLHLYCG